MVRELETSNEGESSPSQSNRICAMQAEFIPLNSETLVLPGTRMSLSSTHWLQKQLRYRMPACTERMTGVVSKTVDYYVQRKEMLGVAVL